MERPITDEDILNFLKRNKASYPSQIELMQAAAQLLWPAGPPTGAGQRIARLVLHEVNSHGEPTPNRDTRPAPETHPLGTEPLPQTNPLA